MALRADERRDKLRKASGRSTYPMIRRYLNGETRQREPLSAWSESNSFMWGTRGTETSKYPEEEKENIDFQSSGERNGRSPNHGACIMGFGLRDDRCKIGEQTGKSGRRG